MSRFLTQTMLAIADVVRIVVAVVDVVDVVDVVAVVAVVVSTTTDCFVVLVVARPVPLPRQE